MKVGESDQLPVVASDAALSLFSLSYSNTVSEMNSLAGVPEGPVAADRTRVYDVYQGYVKSNFQPDCITFQDSLLLKMFIFSLKLQRHFALLRHSSNVSYFYRENNRHELTPSTSTGRTSGKRKGAPFDGEIYAASVGLHGPMEGASGPSNPAVAVTSVKQQSAAAANNSSPLLVNLLR